jgi:coniferyl-aldehyde dehydrogenase
LPPQPRTTASEPVPRFAALLQQVIAQFDAREMIVTGIDDEIAKAFAAASIILSHRLDPRRPSGGGSGGRNLTPATLELGGNRPRSSTARRSRRGSRAHVYGKLLNAGQIPYAPDYALVPESRCGFRRPARGPHAAHVRQSCRQQGLRSIVWTGTCARLESLVADAALSGATIMQAAKPDDPA